jgi:16S rRNA (guanine1207-N2)-methyltransferase
MKYARERFERVDQVGIGTHQCRLYQATGPIPATASAATADPIEHVLTVRQTSIRLQLGAGVFGARGIDPGTTFLLQTAEIPAGVSVLDLGCGAGAIGIHLASEDRRRRVVMTDVSQAAVELASANATRNNLDRVRVLVSDGFAAIARERFEAILSNLPAHRGPVDDPSLAEGLIRETAAHLNEDGNAWFVVNRSRGIELPAARAFRHVEIAAQNARYKVVRCASPRPTRSTRHG